MFLRSVHLRRMRMRVLATLGELERRVMDLLVGGPGTSERTRRRRRVPGYAYTTVATVLDRLVHKGMVGRRMEGRAIKFPDEVPEPLTRPS